MCFYSVIRYLLAVQYNPHFLNAPYKESFIRPILGMTHNFDKEVVRLNVIL